jgi:solute carrier family 35, member F1/2
MVISSLSTIFVIIFGSLILKTRFFPINYIGSFICLVGLSLILASKSQQFEGSNGPDQSIVGDLYALLAAFGYALSNTLNERLARMEVSFKHSKYGFHPQPSSSFYIQCQIGRYPVAAQTSMALFGTFFSTFFLVTLGREDIITFSNIVSQPFVPQNWGLILYPILMVSLYILVPNYFQLFSAIIFNFSMITADLYIFIYNHFTSAATLTNLYLGGVFCIFIGLGVYSCVEPIHYDSDDVILDDGIRSESSSSLRSPSLLSRSSDQN